ncbi:MAG: glycoside hydrolase family 16 protein [Sphingomonadales bacterium]|nr:glycoside hydrolase family 16 protein [Sphingomonadales bacterium]MDE2170441.1 glycoside hydrolase family 16 protein [Sphingomonadales bacterium]
MSLGIDPDYRGMPVPGTEKDAPLGINPFATGPEGLTITARRVSPSLQARLFGRSWATGQLTTKFSFAQKQGYFEAEMNLPTCEKGAWPALWLLPAKGPWPLHGEIDFPETVGDGKVYWTVHTGQGGAHGHSQVVTKGDCAHGWHQYGVMWLPDRIGFYYDGDLVGQSATPSDFTEAMFLIVNLTIGGSWPGAPDPAATQIAMRVKYVKAWRLAQ